MIIMLTHMEIKPVAEHCKALMDIEDITKIVKQGFIILK